jgi:hypothetical protein
MPCVKRQTALHGCGGGFPRMCVRWFLRGCRRGFAYRLPFLPVMRFCIFPVSMRRGPLPAALLAAGLVISGAAPPPDATVAVRTHWAFQAVRMEEPPAVKNEAWVRTPVDRFILAGLEVKGLTPAGAAAREQYLRRVTYGLTGLPPSPGQIDAYLKDGEPGAEERVVDRLLASPQYGERWARHWLDLVRYAETDGYEHDTVRPHAWRYRDYVIRSFNADKPYDRFVREQIAGDELWPEDREARVATAFALLGPDMTDSADQMQRRLNTLNDAADTTASAFLGLTLGCARCHDHKLEPLSQRDYYSFQAFFAPAKFESELEVPTDEEKEAYAAAQAAWEKNTAPAREKLEALEGPVRERLIAEKMSKLAPEVQEAHRTLKDKRTPQQEAVAQETAAQVAVSGAEVMKGLTPEEIGRQAKLHAEIKAVAKPEPLPATMALRNPSGAPEAVRVLMRGDYNSPGEEVSPGFPGVLAQSSAPEVAGAAESTRKTTARRAALAAWIAGPDNTLTARVMVNRIWQHHFGRGLVRTAGDFGIQGTPPTHPELLDWLAREFMTRGWSMKQMHRLIVLSAAYRQSSTASTAALAGDPDNTLFSRQNRVRLEGEAIRDSLLAVSGRLNPNMFGPGVQPPIPRAITAVSKNWNATRDKAEHLRRSIYIFVRRNLRFPFLEVFDAPDTNIPCAERGRSTTAPQALSLLNSEETVAAATALAERLVREVPGEGSEVIGERVRRAFRIVLGRLPGANEQEAATAFLREEPGLSELCRALLNLNAFVYVD